MFYKCKARRARPYGPLMLWLRPLGRWIAFPAVALVVFWGALLSAALSNIQKADRLDYALFKAVQSARALSDDRVWGNLDADEKDAIINKAKMAFTSYFTDPSYDLGSLKDAYETNKYVNLDSLSAPQFVHLTSFFDAALAEKEVLANQFPDVMLDLRGVSELLKSCSPIPVDGLTIQFRLEAYEAVFGDESEPKALLDSLVAKLYGCGVLNSDTHATLEDVMDDVICSDQG